MVKGTTLAGICALLLMQVAGGHAQQSDNPVPNLAPPLKIGPGDLIEITTYDDQDLSGHFRVDEKGDVIVPLLGPVHVAGATAEVAAAAIEKRYVGAQILRPGKGLVGVFISEYATQGITVNGEVKAPGVYPALGVRTLNDVISAAGGEQQTAASKVVISRKSDPQNPITVAYNPEALTPVIPQIQIFPGDSIMVPRAGIVYALGDVNRPGGFILDGRNTLTVQEAIALAGGFGRAAKTNQVHLVRVLEGGRKEDIILSVKMINKGNAPDVAMMDGDVLFVPTSTGKLATEQAISSALQIGTQVAVYRTAIQ